MMTKYRDLFINTVTSFHDANINLKYFINMLLIVFNNGMETLVHDVWSVGIIKRFLTYFLLYLIVQNNYLTSKVLRINVYIYIY